MKYINRTKFLVTACVIASSLAGCAGSDDENTPPTASELTFTPNDNGGLYFPGDTLTATYTFSDKDSDLELDSVYQWYRDGIALDGQNTPSYSLTSDDLDKTLRFEVTPIDSAGLIGETIFSELFIVEDNEPDQLIFSSVSSVDLGSTVTSNIVPVGGLNVPASISIENGEYSKNSTGFTSEPGIIEDGDTIQIRHTVPIESNSVTITNLTVNDELVTFKSTTNSNENPVASNISFAQTGPQERVGGIITALYDYFDADDDVETNSIYQWSRGDTLIPGENNLSYTLTADDYDFGITFSVTPIDSFGFTGTPVTSTQVFLLSDTTPNTFSFVDIIDAELNTIVESQILTVTGINKPTNVSVSPEGYFSVNGRPFTSDVETISENETIQVNLTTSSSYNTAVTATLTIGTETFNFTTTTKENSVPVAENVSFTKSGDNIAYVGDVLTATYAFTDPNNDLEGQSIYQWYREGVLIPGASGLTYVLTDADIDQLISFEILPVDAANGRGEISSFADVAMPSATSPQSLVFDELSDVALDTDVESGIQTISGINVPVTVSIDNGEYSIDSGEFTSLPGTITNGQTIQVKHKTSNLNLHNDISVLTVSSETATFSTLTANYDGQLSLVGDGADLVLMGIAADGTMTERSRSSLLDVVHSYNDNYAIFGITKDINSDLIYVTSQNSCTNIYKDNLGCYGNSRIDMFSFTANDITYEGLAYLSQKSIRVLPTYYDDVLDQTTFTIVNENNTSETITSATVTFSGGFGSGCSNVTLAANESCEFTASSTSAPSGTVNILIITDSNAYTGSFNYYPDSTTNRTVYYSNGLDASTYEPNLPECANDNIDNANQNGACSLTSFILSPNKKHAFAYDSEYETILMFNVEDDKSLTLISDHYFDELGSLSISADGSFLFNGLRAFNVTNTGLEEFTTQFRGTNPDQLTNYSSLVTISEDQFVLASENNRIIFYPFNPASKTTGAGISQTRSEGTVDHVFDSVTHLLLDATYGYSREITTSYFNGVSFTQPELHKVAPTLDFTCLDTDVCEFLELDLSMNEAVTLAVYSGALEAFNETIFNNQTHFGILHTALIDVDGTLSAGNYLSLTGPSNAHILTSLTDTDSDGIINVYDLDDDNDGVEDILDAFPYDATESLDSDIDGVGDNSDALPFDATETLDTDGNGIGNNADDDDDGDGYLDINDEYPLDPTEHVDTDKDFIPDNQDPDDDNDGVEDLNDAFPLDPTETLDTDGDGFGNNFDIDSDIDGANDILEEVSFSIIVPLGEQDTTITTIVDLSSFGVSVGDILTLWKLKGRGDLDYAPTEQFKLRFNNTIDTNQGPVGDQCGTDFANQIGFTPIDMTAVDIGNGVAGLIVEGYTTAAVGDFCEDLPTLNTAAKLFISNKNALVSNDQDDDGIVNSLDLDSDNDGILDIIEFGKVDLNFDGEADDTKSVSTLIDSDSDGIPDAYDLESNNPLNDGTAYDIANSGIASLDTNGDGMFNLLDNPGTFDANNNGIYDAVESIVLNP